MSEHETEEDEKKAPKKEMGETEFLFAISKEVRRFFETPVLLLTKQDFADNVFDTMCLMRTAKAEGGNEFLEKAMNIIVQYHIYWLQAVDQVQDFVTNMKEKPRQNIYESIKFTRTAVGNRLKYYRQYISNFSPKLSQEQKQDLFTDLELLEEMHSAVISMIKEKEVDLLKCFDNDQFYEHVQYEAEELLNWLDMINDNLSFRCTEYIGVKVHDLPELLMKTLEQIIEEVVEKNETKLAEDLQLTSKNLGTVLRQNVHNLEISKIVEKINVLDGRISILKNENSAALMALQHKKLYLEERLNTLQAVHTALESLKGVEGDILKISKIFNHKLPLADRQRLVTTLCQEWEYALRGQIHTRKSMISILSIADLREFYNDEIGTFSIDVYGRKIYVKDGDNTLYQLNENEDLVPLNDDEDKIFFYDNLGRYYLGPQYQRIYKAHPNASEYLLEPSGILIKNKETVNGVEYFFDSFGRYYINEHNNKIYKETDSSSEYENDGLGNLVRIESVQPVLVPCPQGEFVTEEAKYLQQAVGRALRICMADVVLKKPADPILFLSQSLRHFRQVIEEEEKREIDKIELKAAREAIAEEERLAAERAAMEAALLLRGASEASFDSNLRRYSSPGIISSED